MWAAEPASRDRAAAIEPAHGDRLAIIPQGE
jgi:hypothetical protein